MPTCSILTMINSHQHHQSPSSLDLYLHSFIHSSPPLIISGMCHFDHANKKNRNHLSSSPRPRSQTELTSANTFSLHASKRLYNFLFASPLSSAALPLASPASSFALPFAWPATSLALPFASPVVSGVACFTASAACSVDNKLA